MNDQVRVRSLSKFHIPKVLSHNLNATTIFSLFINCENKASQNKMNHGCVFITKYKLEKVLSNFLLAI